MTCVVDASVALKWFLADDAYAAEAVALLKGNAEMVAPDLIVAEACNAAWSSLRLGRIEQSELTEIAAILPVFLLTWLAQHYLHSEPRLSLSS